MTSMSSPDQLSDEELRQYVAQLRESPVSDLLAQAYTMIGAWAEAKLGRRDARTLIDALAGLVQGAEPGLDKDLARQMREGVGQLQMAQVQVEQQLAAQQQQQAGEAAEPEASEQSAQEPARPQSPPGQQPAQESRPMTDRLWIPGRDPRPGGP
jgi:hypothetical protein